MGKGGHAIKRKRAQEAMAVPPIAPPGSDVEKGYLTCLLHQHFHESTHAQITDAMEQRQYFQRGMIRRDAQATTSALVARLVDSPRCIDAGVVFRDIEVTAGKEEPALFITEVLFMAAHDAAKRKGLSRALAKELKARVRARLVNGTVGALCVSVKPTEEADSFWDDVSVEKLDHDDDEPLKTVYQLMMPFDDSEPHGMVIKEEEDDEE